jgi:hypothetical protein
MGRSDEAAQRESQKDEIHSRMLSDEPNVTAMSCSNSLFDPE